MKELSSSDRSAPAVVAIVRRVKPGFEADFEAAVRGVTLAASTFPGYLGGEVLYPENRRGDWQLIVRFDTQIHLPKNWV
jgi:antibiotic biosynthesis monooxygenase (ABM) superfamily enzyme